MLKWNVKMQKCNTDAISLTAKWSQNTNCANLHVRFSIRRYLNKDSHTMLVSKIKDKVFPRLQMNGYLSNVMKFSYAPILYTETNAVEDRAREKGWDRKFCDTVFFYLYDKRSYYIYLIVIFFKISYYKKRTLIK